jgi:hypothetical protein
MIDAYDQQTGDGQWLRQSLQILQDEIDGGHMSENSESAKRLAFCQEYHEITGKELPEHIQNLPLDGVRRAICAARNGIVFGEPKPTEKPVDESSMMDWDRQDQKNGNAYGGS